MQSGHLATSALNHAPSHPVKARTRLVDPTIPRPLVDLSGFTMVRKVRPDGAKVQIELTGSFVIPERLAPGGIELPPMIVPGKDLKVMVFGDSGKGTKAQRDVAASMTKLARDRGTQVCWHTGDIFYPNGVASATDPKIARVFVDLYTGLPPVHATLGNHDYGHITGAGMPEALSEAAALGTPGMFTLPQRYYSRRFITAGNGRTTRVLFLDTSTLPVDIAQLRWLRTQLEKDSDYTVVVGHHPIINNGPHGSSKILQKLLLPLLETRADMYICGHEHNQQQLRSSGGLPNILSGAAAEARPTWPGGKAEFASVRRGASFLTFGPDSIKYEAVSAYKKRTQFTNTFPRRDRKPLPPLPTGLIAMPPPPEGGYKSCHDNGPLVSVKVDKAAPWNDCGEGTTRSSLRAL